MKPFTQHSGIVAPIDRMNVDTDLIIPKQFLKSIKRTGFGVNLFDQLRYLDEGQLGEDVTTRPQDPSFILNKPPFTDASILLVRDNFGCGSSREHAVWALKDYGINVIIGPSFADIFYNNCFKNGLLPIVLEKNIVDTIFASIVERDKLVINVNLITQEIELPTGEIIIFEIDNFRKHRLLNGLDDIALTLEHRKTIEAFETKRAGELPWLFNATT